MKSIFFLVLCGLFCSTLCLAQDVSQNLLIHYKFEGNALDSGGSNFHATVVGATYGPDRDNNPNAAIYFDGINDYIELPNLAELKPNLPVSFSFWIKYEDQTYENATVFNTSYEEDVNSGIYMNVGGSSGRYQISFGDGSPFYSPRSRRTYTSNAVIQPNEWHHIAMVVNSESDMSIYVDCVEPGGSYSGCGGALAYSNTPGSLGRHDRSLTAPGDYFKGALDEFRYWDRALTIEEIAALCDPTPCLVNLTEEDITVENTCLASTTNFSLEGDFDEVLWNFDDPGSGSQNASSLRDPTHLFTAAANYQVSVVVQCGTESNTLYKDITITNPPRVNTPEDFYSCEDTYNSGISGSFDLSGLEQQLIGNQSGLRIRYFDQEGNTLPDNLSSPYRNKIPFTETIYVRVENDMDPECFTETSFKLITHSIPSVDLEKNYSVCPDGVITTLAVDPTYAEYVWLYEDGTIISETATADLIDIGQYTLMVSSSSNDLVCTNSFSFELTAIEFPQISDVLVGGADQNKVEIIASGVDEMEYSIDGINFQDGREFIITQGGDLTVYVRYKNGCGLVSRTTSTIQYPKFFTPNGDGVNEYWNVSGMDIASVENIYIYDRYGKFLIAINPQGNGWDGWYQGKQMPASDYWFTIETNGNKISGHFTLKR